MQKQVETCSNDKIKDEIYDLIRKAQSGNERAKEVIVEKNTGLVRSAVYKFMNTGHEWDDLMQVGYIGLVKAIMRFNCDLNFMFSTYAVHAIIGELRRFLRDDGKIKVPREMKANIFKMKYAREKFYTDHGRSPKISELAEVMELTSEQIMTLIEAEDTLGHFEYLDDPERIQGDEHKDNKDGLSKIDMIALKDAIASLEDRDKQVIILRYMKDMTQQQVAKVLGTSQVQVSRIEKKVLAKMKAHMG